MPLLIYEKHKEGRKWRVHDCFIHSYVFYYWMCRSDVSVISFRMCHFSPTIVFGFVVAMNFLLFIACG